MYECTCGRVHSLCPGDSLQGVCNRSACSAAANSAEGEFRLVLAGARSACSHLCRPSKVPWTHSSSICLGQEYTKGLGYSTRPSTQCEACEGGLEPRPASHSKLKDLWAFGGLRKSVTRGTLWLSLSLNLKPETSSRSSFLAAFGGLSSNADDFSNPRVRT